MALIVYSLTLYKSTGVILVIHLVFHVITIALDPAHVNVRTKYEQLGSHEVEGSFNRGKQRHVIEDQYCCLCEVNVYVVV